MTGMTWGRGLALGVAAVTAIAAATPATATKMVATFAGVIGTSSFDDAGLFGGGDLTGKRYTAVFAYDTDDLSQDFASNPRVIEHQVLGTYSITISDITFGNTAPIDLRMDDDRTLLDDGKLYDTISHAVYTGANDPYLRLQITRPDQFVDGMSPTQTIRYDFVPGWENVSRSSAGIFRFQGTSVYLDSAEVLVAAAVVPELASWVLMLAGFVTVGAALRVRRRMTFA